EKNLLITKNTQVKNLCSVMNRIQHLFQNKTSDILNIYFTAGYPKLDDTGLIIKSLADAGVDLIEIGMPYSDPLADGPTIQESGTAAIANGMTLPILFKQIKDVRQRTDVPLILMGYFNQVMQYGEQAFVDKCAEVGVDGLILPDLPLFEYESYFREMVEAAGLTVSFLITPQTSDERIRKVDELTEGFIYMVSSASITGGKGGISPQQIAYFERINAMQLRNPRLIGFGISDHDTFSTACDYANGAIIGSAFIRALAKGESVEATTQEFVAMVRGAVAV
ncbi:MAG: tryptophan synthase subunit alpha, partial [Saprospiraceae bacterium]